MENTRICYKKVQGSKYTKDEEEEVFNINFRKIEYVNIKEQVEDTFTENKVLIQKFQIIRLIIKRNRRMLH